MSFLTRFKNRIIAKLTSRFVHVSERLTDGFKTKKTEGVPWTPINKPLVDCKVAIVTTSGVHHRNQKPFDMNDPNGDPSFRVIDSRQPVSDLMITHDYYDHSDAEKDINIVFPIQRLWELEEEGIIGKIAEKHYGFMGHILDPQIQTLINQTASQVSKELKKDAVDIVLLTPA